MNFRRASEINADDAYLYYVSDCYWAFTESEVDWCDTYEMKAAGTFDAMLAAHRLLADK